MQTRPFGRTGLRIPELVLGGGVVGGILVLAPEATRRAALERAAAAGIDWIDTAPAYGNGASESAIGEALPFLDPRPRVSTKVRLAPEDLADIPAAVERSLEQSLMRLRLDRIELLQLHNQIGAADSGRLLGLDRVLGRGGVADAMDRLKAQGLIKAAGITALGDTTACRTAIESGRFDSAQVYYNLLNPSAGWERAPAGWSAQDFSGLLAACRRTGVAAMNIRALAGGDLDREQARAAAVWSVLGDEYGTPAQTALRFALGNPDFACVVVGIAELAHLDEALAAVAQGPLPAEALQRLDPLWARDFLTD